MVYDKQYYQDNKDKIKEHQKQYRERNKDKIKEYKKEYSKQYYEQNKDTILTKLKEKITCECGSTINKSEIARHRRSKKHIHYINLLTTYQNQN